MYSEICLTCLCIPKKAHKLNEILLGKLKILEMLHQLVPLYLERQVFELPHNICAKCLENLVTSYKFQKQCLDSVQQLQQMWLENLSKTEGEGKWSNSKFEAEDFELKMESVPELNLDIKMPFNKITIDSMAASKKDLEMSFEQDKNERREDYLKQKIDIENTLSVKLHCNANSNENVQQKFYSKDVREDTSTSTSKCKLCSRIFKRPQGLASHMSKTHFKKHIYQCQKCDKGFSAEEPFIRHCNRHLGIKPFPCTQCDKAFESNTLLNKHLLCHSKEDSSIKICYKALAMSTSNQQIVRKDTEPLNNQCNKDFNSDSNINIQQEKEVEERTYQCQICLKAFFKNQDLNKHIESMHKEQHCIIEDEITMDSITEKQEKQKLTLKQMSIEFKPENNEDNYEEKFKVEYEENRSGNDQLLNVHTIVSSDLEKKSVLLSVQCDLCKQIFKNAQGLAIHKSSKHFKKHLYQCDKCDRGFSVEEFYIKHRNRHLGIKAFKCNQCNKAFESNSVLNQHLISHSKLTPHLCTTCGKGFRRIDSLRQHMRRHGDERPFKCSVCPKSFKCLSDKLRHMMKHDEKRYQCNVCGTRLATSESLSQHQMIHTGQKPYKCRHCDKSFICSINMTRHERIHTGEKPYNCQYCWKTFRQSNDRNKHTRRMHKNEMDKNKHENSETNLE